MKIDKKTHFQFLHLEFVPVLFQEILLTHKHSLVLEIAPTTQIKNKNVTERSFANVEHLILLKGSFFFFAIALSPKKFHID